MKKRIPPGSGTPIRVEGMPKSKKILSITMLVFIVLGLGFCGREKFSCVECNIILISIDTLRADHLGCYGYGRNTSPHVDAFSEESVLFEKCYAPAPSTLPSHASLFTSLIPSHHGAYFTRQQALSSQHLTLAEMVKAAGYQTVSFNDGGQVSAQFGLAQGFDLYHDDTEGHSSGELTFERIVQKAMGWLNGHHRKKFFMFLHTYETHHPYTPDREVLKQFETGYRGKLPVDISVELINRINKDRIETGCREPRLEIDPADQQHIINTYDTEIRTMDASFGKLIRHLKEINLYEKTMVIFTSDHGEEFGEHGVWATHSHSLYNELLHVPLIVKWPGSRVSRKRIATPVGLIDIPVTVLDAMGIDKPGPFQGESLIKLITGDGARTSPYLLAQKDTKGGVFKDENWAIMDFPWKLYDRQLFDLAVDPGEQQDRSRFHQSRFFDLRIKALKTIRQKPARAPLEKSTMDEDLKKKLESLGYL